MKRPKLFLLPGLLLAFTINLNAQTNLRFSDTLLANLLKANYAPANYHNSSLPYKSKQDFASHLYSKVNADSLLRYLFELEAFTNRNSGSDTLSETRGMGAARNWALKRFQSFNQGGGNLQTGFFIFDKAICNMGTHKNTLAILPGADTSEKEIVIIEAHLDSRCENVCDTQCLAQGMEDNGSGVALVLELARVFAKEKFKNTLVFMLTTAEEQGLDGANAFAQYCKLNNIKVKAVLNNDVIGGTLCGKTASPPGCPGENEVDSINVRVFSAGLHYSAHKGLARLIKTVFTEEMLPLMPIKTVVNIMNPEDRTGRGGDHIPFRQQGFAAIRFTSAHEHGDANPQPGYTDRQHSTRDILGKDLNSDNKLDSFYVDTRYLQRNALLNGTAAFILVMNGNYVPDFELINDGNGLSVKLVNPLPNRSYRIGFKSRSNDFDTLFLISGTEDLKTYHVKKDSIYFVSVAAMDANGFTGLFATEKLVKVKGVPPTGLPQKTENLPAMQLLPISPNPIDETLAISVWVKNPNARQSGKLIITDVMGRIVKEVNVQLDKEINEVVFDHGFEAPGLYHCILFVDGNKMAIQKLWFK